MIEYSLTRSRRRTIAIYVNENGSVEVRAPLKAPRRVIDGFVASKEKWIAKNVEIRRRQTSERARFSLDYGSVVPLCGGKYQIAPFSGRRPKFEGGRLLIPAGLSPLEIKQSVILAYRTKAKDIINERIAVFSAVLGVTPRSVRISGAKTRWGSCSGKNAVAFSWRLLMADGETVDYVVVHELAHILEHNHSPRFWAIVSGVFPDYAERRARLKLLHGKLQTEDWD